MLALLLGRLSGCPSFSPAPTIGSSLLGLPHPSLDHRFPRAVIAPSPPLEPWTTLPIVVFLASTCAYTSKIFEPPHCRANHAIRASSSPELRRPDPPFSKLHLHQSFVVTGASRPDFLLHWRFVVTCRHRSSPKPRDQSPTFYLSSTSIFRDYLIRCLSPSSHYQRQSTLFILATTIGPRIVATICSDHLGVISPTSAATAPLGLPLQTATSGKAPCSWPLPTTPTSSYRQRRPAGAYFADSCIHRAGRPVPSVRY